VLSRAEAALMNRGKYKLVVLGLSLAALTAGFVAGWNLRSRAHTVSEDKSTRALTPPPRPSSSREQFIIFSAEKNPPPTTPDLLPATANHIYCFYSFPQLAADARITIHWWRDGKDLGLLTDLQAIEAQGNKPDIAPEGQKEGEDARPGRYVVLSPPAGEDKFAPGMKIMASQPSKVGEVRVVSCVTAREVTPTSEPQQPVSKFAPQDRIYVAFAYINGTRGEKLRVEWYGGDQRLESAAQKLTMKGAAGRGAAWLQAEDRGLPAGEYRVAVYDAMAEAPLAEVRFTVHP